MHSILDMMLSDQLQYYNIQSLFALNHDKKVLDTFHNDQAILLQYLFIDVMDSIPYGAYDIHVPTKKQQIMCCLCVGDAG